MGNARVVGINSSIGNNGRTFHGGAKPLPQTLVQLRDHIKSTTAVLLRKLFDNADDALFDLADKAGTNGEQAQYFDAMRELRLKRKQVGVEVMKGIIRSFNEIGHHAPAGKDTEANEFDLDDLSLIKHEELEETVALDSMVNRLKTECKQELEHYYHRIRSIIEPIEISASDIPFSPEILCQSFISGCENLSVDIRAKLVVLKLFEKYVLSEMGRVYGEANQYLAKQGVLPDLRGSQKRKKQSKKMPPNGPSAASSAAKGATLDGATGKVIDAENRFFDDLRNLMHPEGTGAGYGSPAAGGCFSQNQIVSALSNVQHQPALISTQEVRQGLIDFRGILNGLLNAAAQEKRQFSEVDQDVINLVSMLFEFILDDRQLQSEMKALIARLQIPILKVALLDKSFFDRGGHPARKLLNDMASAAIGWNPKREGTKDPLKEKIEYVVSRVLDDFSDNLDLFAELQEQFSSFLDKDQRRGQLVEQRTKDSEQGKAINETARIVVQDAMNGLIANKNVPASIIELLQDGWSQVMVLTYLKKGDDSQDWFEQSKLVEDLVWTVCPDQSVPDARSKLLKMIPGVLKSLRSGLNSISFDAARMTEMLKELETIHVHAIQKMDLPDQPEPVEQEPVIPEPIVKADTAPEVVAEETALFDEEPLNDALGGEGLENEVELVEASEAVDFQDQVIADLVRETLEMEEEFQVLPEPEVAETQISEPAVERYEQAEIPDTDEVAELVQAQPVESAQAEDAAVEETTPAQPLAERETEEIVLVSLQNQDKEAFKVDENDPFIQQVDKLSVGGWFEFQDEGNAVRCKLAAVIKATGKYIFVNRSGVKVAEKSRMGLAVELRRGSIQILNDGLLFDRALESIIGNLRGKIRS